jgi:hypothetical protein
VRPALPAYIPRPATRAAPDLGQGCQTQIWGAAALAGPRLDLRSRAAGLDDPCGLGADEVEAAATMTKLATVLHRLGGRSP